MIIKQLAVFLEDRSDGLPISLRILAEHEINITALSLAETARLRHRKNGGGGSPRSRGVSS